MNLKILLADDHKLSRMAVKYYLLGTQIAREVLEAANGVEALNLLQSNAIDILILDMKMPELNGFETAKRALSNYPRVKILVVTMFNEPALVLNFISLGVHGYMLKNDGKLDSAIEMVMDNKFYYSKELENTIKKAQVCVKKVQPISLNEKEKKIIQLISEGKNSEEIGLSLSLTKSTVESYRKDLIEKCQVNNSSELINYAHRTGLL
jgi:DNA-binding NarL/FixJ family response regulator